MEKTVETVEDETANILFPRFQSWVIVASFSFICTIMRLLSGILLFLSFPVSCNVNSRQSNQAKEKGDSALHSFENITNNIDNSLKPMKEENKLMYDYAAQFTSSLPFDSLKSKTEEIICFIDSIKNLIQKQSTGAGDKSVTNEIMIAEGNALQLKNMLIGYENFINHYLKDPLLVLDTKPAVQSGKHWEQYYFQDVPAIAAITILTKFEQDLVTYETSTLMSWLENLK